MILTMAFAVIVAVAILGCSLALALSVWAKKPHEVVAVVYTLWAFMVLAYPVMWLLASTGLVVGPPRWLLVADPFYLAFASYVAPGSVELADYPLVPHGRSGGFGRAGAGSGLAHAAGVVARDRRRQEDENARRARPNDPVASRSVAGREPRSLAGMASAAAVSLGDGPGLHFSGCITNRCVRLRRVRDLDVWRDSQANPRPPE